MAKAAKVHEQLERSTNFQPGQIVVHPVHGVGEAVGVVESMIADLKLECYEFSFADCRLVLRIPTAKLEAQGMRPLSSASIVEQALDVAKGRPKVNRTVWGRRSAEYMSKINSGDPRIVAEVVRDLGGNIYNPDRSFGERQIFESAVRRLAAELAVVRGQPRAEAEAQLLAVFVPPAKKTSAKQPLAELEEASDE